MSKKTRSLLFIMLLPLIAVVCGDGGSSGSGNKDSKTGSATFTWTAPNTNEDGSCTSGTDLTGYKFYYSATSRGTDSSFTYTGSVSVLASDSSITCSDSGSSNGCGNIQSCSATVSGLPTGTWYIAVTAYDGSSYESDYSNEATKTVK